MQAFVPLENVIAAEIHEKGYNGNHHNTKDDVCPHERAIVFNQFAVTHSMS